MATDNDIVIYPMFLFPKYTVSVGIKAGLGQLKLSTNHFHMFPPFANPQVLVEKCLL